MSKKGYLHKIHKNLCKGCELCVHYCPKNVLEMGEDGKVFAPRADDCIGCHLCEMRCPDFAIQVEECEYVDIEEDSEEKGKKVKKSKK